MEKYELSLSEWGSAVKKNPMSIMSLLSLDECCLAAVYSI